MYTEVGNLTADLANKEVRIRARLHNSRSKGNSCFIVCREGMATVQAVLFKGENISKGMVTFSSKISRESIIEIVADVSVPENPIEGCSQSAVELQVKEIWCLNKSAPVLPFQLEDASRLVLNQEAETKGPVAGEEE